MILNKEQFEAAYTIGREFYNHSMITLRLTVAVGVRVVFTPHTIEVIDGLGNEQYSLLEDFQVAYASVV